MEGIKAVYFTRFSGTIPCRIIGKVQNDNVEKYLIRITSKKYAAYSYGDILSTMGLDLFDKQTATMVKGKEWKNSILPEYERIWYNGGKNFKFEKIGD